MVDGIGGSNFREFFINSTGSITKGEDINGIFNRFKKLGKNENTPLDSMGRLKEGWQYNPKTGEFRKSPTITGGPLMGSLDKDGHFVPNENPWIEGGSSIREHNGDTSIGPYIPSIDDYEPTFEIKDGKLVKTGKIERGEKIRYY